MVNLETCTHMHTQMYTYCRFLVQIDTQSVSIVKNCPLVQLVMPLSHIIKREVTILLVHCSLYAGISQKWLLKQLSGIRTWLWQFSAKCALVRGTLSWIQACWGDDWLLPVLPLMAKPTSQTSLEVSAFLSFAALVSTNLVPWRTKHPENCQTVDCQLLPSSVRHWGHNVNSDKGLDMKGL